MSFAIGSILEACHVWLVVFAFTSSNCVTLQVLILVTYVGKESNSLTITAEP